MPQRPLAPWTEDGTDGIVDLELPLNEEHRLDDDDAGDRADDAGRCPIRQNAQGAVMATRPASMPLHIIVVVGLSCPETFQTHMVAKQRAPWPKPASC